MIRFAHVQPGPVGAPQFLALIAYPHADQSEQRLHFVRCAIARAYKAAGKHPPPEFRGLSRRSVEAAVNQADYRIRTRRIPAIWMAMHQLDLSADDELGGWSQNKAARMLLDSAGSVDPAQGPVLESAEDDALNPTNIRARVWRDSLPALAMTMALPLDLIGHNPSDPMDLLADAEWTGRAVEDARNLAPPIATRFQPKYLLVPYR